MLQVFQNSQIHKQNTFSESKRRQQYEKYNILSIFLWKGRLFSPFRMFSFLNIFAAPCILAHSASSCLLRSSLNRCHKGWIVHSNRLFTFYYSLFSLRVSLGTFEAWSKFPSEHPRGRFSLLTLLARAAAPRALFFIRLSFTFLHCPDLCKSTPDLCQGGGVGNYFFSSLNDIKVGELEPFLKASLVG